LGEEITTVLLTGSSGKIGSVLRRGLPPRIDLRLFDRSPPAEGSDRALVLGDLTDLPALGSAMDDVDCVIHLAGIPEEAPFDQLVEDNIRGTYNVFEAARRAGVRRVIFASTNHVVGFHPSSEVLDVRVETRPDTLYGVSKVFGEALGRLFHDKYGLEVICVRIGSFRSAPSTYRELGTWLSHADAVRLFTACVEAPDVEYLVVYGVSANQRSPWRDDAAGALGYYPQDDAEAFAEGMSPPGPDDRFHGGAYTSPGHVGGF
jgi:uronate dehydrogenase